MAAAKQRGSGKVSAKLMTYDSIVLVSSVGESLYANECLEFLISDSCKVAIKLRTDNVACRGISQRFGRRMILIFYRFKMLSRSSSYLLG